MVPYFPDAIQTWDVNALNWIQEHICNPVLDAIFPVITLFGEKGLFLIAVAVIWIYKKFKNKFNNGYTKNVDDIEYMSSQQSGDVDNNSEVIDVDYKDVQ